MTDMEHAIEHAAAAIRRTREFQAGAAFGVPEDAYEAYTLGVARALAEAGLLTPAPLREDQRSEHTVRETAAYFARKVQRIGDRISDRDYRRSLVDVLALENVQGFLDRIARDDLDVYATDAVDRAEGESWYDAEPDAMPDAGWEPIEPADRAEGDGSAAEREPSVSASQLRAFARLCIYWGDMTPAAARMLDRIIEDES